MTPEELYERLVAFGERAGRVADALPEMQFSISNFQFIISNVK